jgi:hypothetical protein
MTWQEEMDDLGSPVGVRVLERPADPPGESRGEAKRWRAGHHVLAIVTNPVGLASSLRLGLLVSI